MAKRDPKICSVLMAAKLSFAGFILFYKEFSSGKNRIILFEF
jgi:hypothetical protein